MNIKDLQPGSYTVVSQPTATKAPLNIKNLAPGSFSVVNKQTAAPAPAASPKQPGFLGSLYNNVDQAINKPAFSMGTDNKSGPVGTAAKSVANTAKDIGANIWSAIKMPFMAAKNIAYDIPKAAVFGDGESGMTPVPGGVKNAATKKATTSTYNQSAYLGNIIPQLPSAAVKNIIPAAIQAAVPDVLGGAKPQGIQVQKGIQSVAEKPVSNILPYVLGASGIEEMRGNVEPGELTTGSKILDKGIEKVGGAGESAIKAPFKAAIKTVKAIPDAINDVKNNQIPGAAKSPADLKAASDASIRTGMQKGVKPTILGKQSLARQSAFYDNARSAVQTISENRSQIKITDPETGEVSNQPKTNAEFSQALDQAKSIIYKKYSAMTKAAGDAGATADVRPIVGKLYNTAFSSLKFNPDGTIDLENSVPNVKYGPEVRKAALDMIPEVKELHGTSPEILENRIKELNGSLASYYAGKTDKAVAQIDASVASNLRDQLDQNITDALNKPGYQELKNQYGALKSLEKDVNKRAIVTARANAKGLPETLTNIWSGAEMVSGLFGNPAAFIKGAAGNAFMAMIKKINAPDTYISKMFDDAYKAYPEKTDTSEPLNTPQSEPPPPDTKNILPRTPIKNISPKGEGAIPDTTTNQPVDLQSSRYTPNSIRTAESILKSKNQTSIGNYESKNFELGDYGRQHLENKTFEGKQDRFPETELPKTIKNIINSYRASDDSTNYRYDNTAWVSKMPNGELRILYSRINKSGANEIIGWHILDQQKNPKFLSTLESFGSPAGN